MHSGKVWSASGEAFLSGLPKSTEAIKDWDDERAGTGTKLEDLISFVSKHSTTPLNKKQEIDQIGSISSGGN